MASNPGAILSSDLCGSIDPGAAYYAWAGWDYVGNLVHTCLYYLDQPWSGEYQGRVAIERPRIMPGRKVKASSVEGVLIGYGRLCERYPNHVDFAPHTVPEKIWHARILKLLSPAEKDIVFKQSASVRKHTIDAVGIGLQYLGRL